MNNKIIPFVICCFTVPLIVCSDTDSGKAEASEEIITAKAPGLIDMYSLSCAADTQTLYVSASTNGSERMAEVGIKNILIEKSADGLEWSTERKVSDAILSDTSTYSVSRQSFEVEGDFFYRVSLEHYAKEDKKWFPLEQEVADVSPAVFVPSFSSDNVISVSEWDCDGNVISENGTPIPEGAKAFTVSIAENRGLSLSEFFFTVDGYEILTDGNGRPLFRKGENFNYNSIISGSVNGNSVAFESLCAFDFEGDGEIFTFFAKEDFLSETKECSVRSVNLCGSLVSEYGSISEYVANGCPLKYYNDTNYENKKRYDSVYMVGDFNNDMQITPEDAFIAHQFLYMRSGGGDFLYYKDLAVLYLPYISDVRAAFIWNDYNDSDIDMVGLTYDTSREILSYCADIAVGKMYDSSSHICEICHIN